MVRLVSSLMFVAAAVVVFWAILELLGFETALMTSLAISLVLTLLFNLGFAAFSRRRRHLRY